MPLWCTLHSVVYQLDASRPYRRTRVGLPAQQQFSAHRSGEDANPISQNGDPMSTDSTDVSRASTGELETDFHYRDKIAAVEPYGVDAIPDSERHGKPVSQFFIWFAAGMNFPIMVLGFLAVSYGLSLTSSVTAIVAGSLLGSIVMGILSRMGGRLGVAQQIQARGPLGFFGNFLPVALKHHLGAESLRGLKRHPFRTAVIDGFDGTTLSRGKLLGAAIALSRHLKESYDEKRIGIVLPTGKGNRRQSRRHARE